MLSPTVNEVELLWTNLKSTGNLVITMMVITENQIIVPRTYMKYIWKKSFVNKSNFRLCKTTP